ncbi:Por secretion system C-terminal sorting domain [Chryseobacterium taklimakanense]|uniref:Por secretion system C-terminal sorting domain n=1 Tax=Chryseobacterium taklimakanense TaxID=536441 RepID=A0A239X734_9FLAO|nr:lamin tail domain-containing protein [Chryseobacterium taklimakanense]SNV42216.1 Por secretion system C-terminal sorting domain [Chryseobacterium taklimakanense]
MKKLYSLLATVVATIAFSQGKIVINEIYGAGGNSGATYTCDYVELKNIGDAPLTLTGASLQYAASGSSSTFNSYQALPEITLSPNQTYLIQEACGTNGAPLPVTADFVGTTNTSFTGTVYNTPLNFAASNGKVALVSNYSQVVSPTDANVIDFVGYGTASLYEGTAPAPAASTTKSVERISGDSNNNGADFAAVTPTPTNSTLAVSDITSSKVKFIKNTLVTNTIEFSAKANVKIYSVNGQVVKTAAVNDGTSLDISALAKGVYVVAGDVDGHSVSQKIIKK